MTDLKTTVYARLDAIAASEKITRVELAALSREALRYVMDTHDIDLVNRLVGVLTPMNARTAILYFAHFLPWAEEKTPEGQHVRFGKMVDKPKQVVRKAKAIEEWLSDEGNNIWLWASEHIEVEVKKKDFSGMIAKLVTKALTGDEKSETPPLSKADIMKAVMLGGVTSDDLMELLTTDEEGQAQLEAEVMQEEAA